jgi:hypothetical protein
MSSIDEIICRQGRRAREDLLALDGKVQARAAGSPKKSSCV